jgi:hypothetical protein
VSCVSYVASFSGLFFYIAPSVFIGYTRHRTNKC